MSKRRIFVQFIQNGQLEEKGVNASKKDNDSPYLVKLSQLKSIDPNAHDLEYQGTKENGGNYWCLLDKKKIEDQNDYEIELEDPDKIHRILAQQANESDKLWDLSIPRRYKSDPEAIRNKELERYVKIGTYCRQEPVSQSVLQEFEEVVGKVYKHKNEFQYGIPFIFVCSSSGMGKTQLPFTMNSPVIYFTYSSSDTQNKYMPFMSISQVLFDNLEQDQINYQLAWKGTDHGLSQMSARIGFKSWTAGFLVNLLERVYRIRNEDPTITWIQAQLACPDFYYEPMSIGTSQTRIEQIRNGTLLTIFLDEAINIKESEFRFKRSLIRALGLALVIMGTNINAVNFVDKKITDGGSREDDLQPWCYLFHKLPPLSARFLDETYFQQVNAQVNDWSSNDKQKLGLLVNSLFGILKSERPLFAHRAAQSVQRFVNSVVCENKKIDSNLVCEFIDELVQYIFQQFVLNKKAGDVQDFSVEQLDLIDPRPRNQLPSIHIHLDFISESGDIEKSSSYFPLYLKHSMLHCKIRSSSLLEAPRFKKFDVRPSFDQMPLTSLSFTALTNLFIEEYEQASSAKPT